MGHAVFMRSLIREAPHMQENPVKLIVISVRLYAYIGNAGTLLYTIKS